MSSTLPSRQQLGSEGVLDQEHQPEDLSGVRRTPVVDAKFHRRLPSSSLRLARGTTGDHPLVHRFLQSMLHGPANAEYYAQLEEPTYEPLHRTLIKQGEQIVGHVRVSNHDLHFGAHRIPAIACHDLVTLPEYRAQGCEDILCKSVEHQTVADGAVMGIVKTSNSAPFVRNGWSVFCRHTYSQAPVRDILAHLSATKSDEGSLFPDDFAPNFARRKKRRNLTIRLWRHVEQAALARLYTENTINAYGPAIRHDAYWRWLVSRCGYDRLYIAIDGPDKLELDERLEPIVGYAVMKDGRLMETMTTAECPQAAAQLLARACGDAIEQDQSTLRVDAEDGNPLHQLVVDAGGSSHHHEAKNGEVFLMKMVDPISFLLSIRDDFKRRVEPALSCELGLLVDGKKYRLIVTQQDVELVPGKLGRSYLQCTASQLGQLLLGHYAVEKAVASGRFTASTSIAIDLATQLFPKLPMWRPPWDDMPA